MGKTLEGSYGLPLYAYANKGNADGCRRADEGDDDAKKVDFVTNGKCAVHIDTACDFVG